MYQLYDREFKKGFGISTLVFLILNVKSYFDSFAEYERSKARRPSFSPATYFSWGYPVEGFDVFVPLLNIIIIALCGFLVGLAFRFISQKMSKKN